MTKETIIRIHRIYSILLGVVIIIAGICLIAGCLVIYDSGEFSREIVAETFSGIAFPVYLCLGMTIINFLFEILLAVRTAFSKKEAFPTQKGKPSVQKNYSSILNRLYSNKDLETCDEAVRKEIIGLQKNRNLHIIIRTIVLVLSSIVFLIYALNGDNFHQSEINSSMIKAMWILIPCLAVSFGYALFTTIYNEKSIQKEIELLKQLPTSPKKDNTSCVSNSEKKQNICRLAFLFVAVFFLVYGFLTGGTADVLTKAINICTECIGLG